ncbi:MAG: rhombosortase [Pseudomonadota bacterium]
MTLYWPIAALVAISTGLLALSAIGDPGRALLRYDAELVSAGEIWRLLSAHVVHLGLAHTLLNVAGLVLIGLLFAAVMTPSYWLLATVCSALSVSLGLYWFNPTVIWYVGFSGVLHGLFVAGATAMSQHEKVLAIGLLVGLAAKLGFEQWVGPMPGSEHTAGGRVIVDAHLYGAIGGWLASVLQRLLKRL